MSVSKEEYEEALRTVANAGQSGCDYANEGFRQLDIDEAMAIIREYESENS
jgi:hypothetical protein